MDETLFTGGYPRIFDQRLDPSTWLSAYVGAYIERDVRSVTNVGDLSTFQRFVGLCAGRSGQLLNLSSLAADCGISQPTAKVWLSLIETTYIAFRLPAFSGNLRKRLVKMPKLHFYDTGLMCWLLGIRSPEQLQNHPLRGAIFETWVEGEILWELAQLRRDPRLFGLLVIAPVLELTVLGFVVTNDIRDIDLALRDRDHTSTSREFARAVAASGYFVIRPLEGALEQLLVTPIRPVELIFGKVMPFVVVGFLEVTIAMPMMVVILALAVVRFRKRLD